MSEDGGLVGRWLPHQQNRTESAPLQSSLYDYKIQQEYSGLDIEHMP